MSQPAIHPDIVSEMETLYHSLGQRYRKYFTWLLNLLCFLFHKAVLFVLYGLMLCPVIIPLIRNRNYPGLLLITALHFALFEFGHRRTQSGREYFLNCLYCWKHLLKTER
jgi:hypothetical protein